MLFLQLSFATSSNRLSALSPLHAQTPHTYCISLYTKPLIIVPCSEAGLTSMQQSIEKAVLVQARVPDRKYSASPQEKLCAAYSRDITANH